MIIVNADDFGISNDVNRAILTCFEHGVVSSATIMANMPGFEHACELAHKHGLTNRIGLHLNITSGKPLTSGILELPVFCNKKREFCYQKNSRMRFSRFEKDALTKEIRAQICRCVDMGLQLTHLDSHHHAHTVWPVFCAIKPLLAEYGLKYVRLSRNDIVGMPIYKKLYKAAFNYNLARLDLRKTRYFGDYDGFVAMYRRDQDKCSFEIRVHPAYSDDGKTIYADGIELIPAVQTLVNNGLSLSSFAQRE
jgi:predicted glycoside hydrolase/deacetylase ChbG (UPF0249 family)